MTRTMMILITLESGKMIITSGWYNLDRDLRSRIKRLYPTLDHYIVLEQ